MNNILYKYRVWNRRSADIVQDDRIWFSSFGELNDPMEGLLKVNHANVKAYFVLKLANIQGLTIAESEHRINAADSNGEIDWGAGERRLIDIIKSQVHVLSLASRADSPVMWSHYSGQGSGVCLGIECVDAPESFDPVSIPSFQGKFFRKVTYDDRIPILNWHPSHGPAGVLDILVSKQSCWSYEHEVRALNWTENPSKGILAKMPRRSVKELILGWKMDPVNKAEVIQLCKSLGIKALQAMPNPYSGVISIDPLQT